MLTNRSVAEKAAPPIRHSIYTDPFIISRQKAFDSLVAGGASIREREKFIEDVFVEKNRVIRICDYNQMNPSTISTDYLRPRKDLSFFVLSNWTKHIFLEDLKPKVADDLFMFGLGRMFSTYNDIGVQVGTDADVNLIIRDAASASSLKYLQAKLLEFSASIYERFGIVIEINPAFTILRVSEVLENISNGGAKKANSARLFYKANAKSIYIIKDDDAIRKSIFSKVERLPDRLMFEHFLGLGSAKPSYMKLRTDKDPLVIVADGSGEKLRVRNVIGSTAFGKYCRVLFPRELFIPPPDWIFSMKYFVNRVYDYICAMQNMGHSLERIGFAGGKSDPDFMFVQNAHRMMLFLQELIQLNSATFGTSADFSFMSRSRFLRFSELRGDKFRHDFDELILGGELMQPSNKAKYAALQGKVSSKARDRIVVMNSQALEALPKDFAWEIIERTESGVKIQVPYSHADVGYFAFSVIASRVANVVEAQLYPPAYAAT